MTTATEDKKVLRGYLKRLFLLKFAKPETRRSLVIESGFRCHLTDYTRATAAAPSAFVARLRKFLKSRRVTSVSQVGTDRIIEIQFSEGQYRLFLEFYAGGNIVLTDKDLTVISLLRVVNEASEQLRVGLKYLLEDRQNYHGTPAITAGRIRDALQRSANETTSLTQRKIKKPEHALRKALATSLNELPPLVIDHALRVACFDSKTSVDAVLANSSLMDQLVSALEEAQILVKNITKLDTCQGYILAKPSKNARTATSNTSRPTGDAIDKALVYDDFQPFRPRQIEESPETTVLEFEGFNKTVDEFFSSVESQKILSRLNEREENARRKLEAARLDHEQRLGGLQQIQELNVRKAQAIEANLPRVQEAIAAVNGLLAQGMDWMDVSRLIEMEQAKQNAVAEMIKLPLKLYENSVTLLLSESNSSEEDDFQGEETDSDVSDSSVDELIAKSTKEPKIDDKRLAVDVDLALSPWSNARQYYDQKKSAAVKEQKTLQSSEKALKNTEKKVNADLKKGLRQEKEVMRPQRKAFWFEKFLYFISSEGYLVIGGKDAPQNEILYKRYLKKGDVYIHADLHGAASVIIKNKSGIINSPIPPSTLSQAGTLAVATSSAWDSKAGMSAWWVNADQVSKMSSSGELLTAGTFTIRGQKNFLPPAQLLLGFGLFFKVSEESKARHLKHRLQENDQTVLDTNENLTNNLEDIGEAEIDPCDQTRDDHEDQPNQDSNRDDDTNDHHQTDKDENNSDTDGQEPGPYTNDPQFQNLNPLQPIESRLRNSSLSYLSPRKPDPQSSSESSASAEFPDSEEPNDGNMEQGVRDRTRHLSAKERRILRKGAPAAAHNTPNAEIGTLSSEEEDDEASFRVPISNSMKQSETKSQLIVRGKHGKRQKIKTKYADQDDEDRALAMRLLGANIAKEKASEDAASKVAKEQEQKEQKERRRKQHELAAARGKESEFRRLNLGEGIESLDDVEKEEMENIDAFVGAPLPGDDILDALVVCGPWDAVGTRCRWRVKLQPGATKKGKAVREILGNWLQIVAQREKKRRPGSGEGNESMVEEQKVRTREADLIRAIREPEVIGAVPVGKVRVVTGPGEAGGRGKGSGGIGKGKRGGRGSKKQR
ncbi:hypothetical protein ACLMJK_008073 [Lecanora helva]